MQKGQDNFDEGIELNEDTVNDKYEKKDYKMRIISKILAVIIITGVVSYLCDVTEIVEVMQIALAIGVVFIVSILINSFFIKICHLGNILSKVLTGLIVITIIFVLFYFFFVIIIESVIEGLFDNFPVWVG